MTKHKKREFHCIVCGLTKPSKAFRNDKRVKSGKRNTCMVCENLVIRENKQRKKEALKVIRKKEKVLKQMMTLNDDTSKKSVDTRLKEALKVVFGDNLEHIVNELQNLIYSDETKDAVKLSAINAVIDRVIGKPSQHQIIEQKTVNVVINKPDLNNVIDIP